MTSKKFEIGEKVRLDAGYANSSIVEVEMQSTLLMYTRVKSDGQTWVVMTNRLSKILNVEKNARPKKGE